MKELIVLTIIIFAKRRSDGILRKMLDETMFTKTDLNQKSMKILKKLLVFLSVSSMLVMIQCSCSEKKQDSRFNGDILNLDDSLKESRQPIKAIASLAKRDAEKIINLQPANIAQALEEAKSYAEAIIIVGNHTVVKITDFNDCKKSSSWKTNMPYGKGYVQNKGLNKCADYINQLIGQPDNQSRVLYLFNNNQ